MSIINPVISSVISRAIKNVLGLSEQLSIFINLESTAFAYYSFSFPWSPSDNYSIEANIYFSGNSIRITGNSSNFNSRLVVSSNGMVSWRSDTTPASLETEVGVVPLNKFSAIKVVRTGTTGEIFVGDNLIISGAVPDGPPLINSSGRTANSYTDGIISNLKLTNLTTVSNSFKFGLDKLTGRTETNNGMTITYESISETQDVRDSYKRIGNVYSGSNMWDLGDYTYSAGHTGFKTLTGIVPNIRAGTQYSWEWTQNVVGSAETRLRFGGLTDTQISSGTFSGVDYAVSDEGAFLLSGSGSNSPEGTTITDISINKRLEVAP